MQNNKKRSFYLRMVGVISALTFGGLVLKNQGETLQNIKTENNAIEMSLNQQEEFKNAIISKKGREHTPKAGDLVFFDLEGIDFNGAEYNVIYDLIEPNENTARIEGPKRIMIHDTAIQGVTAEQIGRYLKNRGGNGDGNLRDISYHCCVDYKTGELRIFVPFSEKAVAAENMNDDTIHVLLTESEDGYTEKEMITLTDVLARLCETFGLTPEEDILRHCDTQQDREDPKYLNDSSEETKNNWKKLIQKVGIQRTFIRYHTLRNLGFDHASAMGILTTVNKEIEVLTEKKDSGAR